MPAASMVCGRCAYAAPLNAQERATFDRDLFVACTERADRDGSMPLVRKKLKACSLFKPIPKKKAVTAVYTVERLSAARRSAGMTVSQAAYLMGVTAEHLEGWERGDRITVTKLRKLANLYRESLAYFYLPALTPALKPCPFCGGEAEVEREGTPRQSCIVACTYCGCRLESNEDGAGYHWNLRK